MVKVTLLIIAQQSYLTDSAQLTSEETQVIKEDLHNIVNDITERLNDQNMVSGVKKFIKSYTRMQHSSFASTATISYMHYIILENLTVSYIKSHV